MPESKGNIVVEYLDDTVAVSVDLQPVKKKVGTDEGGFTIRSLRLPSALWLAIDADAERCSRTTTKHLEAILKTYYGTGSVELRDIAPVRNFVSPGLAVEPKQPPHPPRTGYLMSLGSGTSPTKEEEELVRPDVEKALRFAAEHEAKKRKQRQK